MLSLALCALLAVPVDAPDPSEAAPDDWSALAVLGAVGVGMGATVAYLGAVPFAVGLVFYDSGDMDLDIRITYALLGVGVGIMGLGFLMLFGGVASLGTDIALDLLE